MQTNADGEAELRPLGSASAASFTRHDVLFEFTEAFLAVPEEGGEVELTVAKRQEAARHTAATYFVHFSTVNISMDAAEYKESSGILRFDPQVRKPPCRPRSLANSSLL